MTVKELMEILKAMPQDSKVTIYHARCDDDYDLETVKRFKCVDGEDEVQLRS